MTSGRLAALSALVAVGGVAGYILLFRVAAVRNHPQIYVATAAVATVLAVLALVRARRWPAWLAAAADRQSHREPHRCAQHPH